MFIERSENNSTNLKYDNKSFYGVFWFSKKGKEDHSKKIDLLNHSIRISFTNVKQDISNILKSIEHNSKILQESEHKHKIHHERYEEILNRLETIEGALRETNTQQPKDIPISIPKDFKSKIKPNNILWQELTDIQKLICFKLASLHKENPNTWISFKSLAREVYPNKEYKKIKSLISEYTDILEELGYLKKKRKGRRSYLKSTDKNPHIKNTYIKIPEIKTKKSKKLEV